MRVYLIGYLCIFVDTLKLFSQSNIAIKTVFIVLAEFYMEIVPFLYYAPYLRFPMRVGLFGVIIILVVSSCLDLF